MSVLIPRLITDNEIATKYSQHFKYWPYGRTKIKNDNHPREFKYPRDFFLICDNMHALETSRILTDEYSAKILLATMTKPRSAFELSESLGIPIAACYRKIHLLEKTGLLVCAERRLTQAGKRIGLYQSRVRIAQIIFERNRIRARIEMSDGTTENYNYDFDFSALIKEHAHV
jgi:hypothetical protein